MLPGIGEIELDRVGRGVWQVFNHQCFSEPTLMQDDLPAFHLLRDEKLRLTPSVSETASEGVRGKPHC